MGLFSLFGESNILYFPGCTYYKHREGFELYKKIFSKLGIRFKLIEEALYCGIEILEAGYEQEARKLCRKNLQIFSEEGIKSIITTSPPCYKMFLKNYPEILPDWNIEVKNLWKLILEKLTKKPKLIDEKATEIVTFHDSCYLGRYCGIYEEPRKILEAIGYEIREMDNSKKESFCCGSCGNLPVTNQELADKIAKERIMQARRIRVKKMIVCCFDNYEILKRNADKIEILELSDVLAKALNIKETFVEENFEKTWKSKFSEENEPK